MTTVILAEKPSQARSYMEGLKIKHTAKQHKASGTTFLDEHTVIVAAAANQNTIMNGSKIGTILMIYQLFLNILTIC